MIEFGTNYNAVWIGVGIFLLLVVIVYMLAVRVVNHAFNRRLADKRQADAETAEAFERIERGARPSISRFKL